MAACTITLNDAIQIALDATLLDLPDCTPSLTACGFLSADKRLTYGRRVQRLTRERKGCKVKLSDLPLDGDTTVCEVGEAVKKHATEQ